MSDHPKATVILIILVIAAALLAGIFYLGRTPNVAVDNAKPARVFLPAGSVR